MPRFNLLKFIFLLILIGLPALKLSYLNHESSNIDLINVPVIKEPLIQIEQPEVVKEKVKEPKQYKKIYLTIDISNLEQSFMGNWIIEQNMDLIDQETDQPIKMNMSFNAYGEGLKTIRFPTGVLCHAPIGLRMLIDGSVSIRDLDYAKCSDQSHFAKAIILCQQLPNQQTSCQMEQFDGDIIHDIRLFRMEEVK